MPIQISVFVVAVALLLAAQLLPVALETVEAVLERVALLAFHAGVQNHATVLE
jgi:hypothetical protein